MLRPLMNSFDERATDVRVTTITNTTKAVEDCDVENDSTIHF
jgi:hypothetical protein